MIAPATTGEGIPMACPIPIKAIPTVAVVDQEDPVLKLTNAEMIVAVGRNKLTLIKSRP